MTNSEQAPAANGVDIDLAVIRKWPEGFDARLQHVWLDVVSFIPNVKLYDLQRVLAEFGFEMTVREPAVISAPVNQCDGCQAGMPLNERGNHFHDGRVNMGCQADRYQAPKAEHLYVSGPYQHDGAFSVCEVATARILHKFWLTEMPHADEDDSTLLEGQVDDFFEGFGASEDHADFKKALLQAGLSSKTYERIMWAIADSRRLNWLQGQRATVEILPDGSFRVAGKRAASSNLNIREAIDSAKETK